MCPLFCIIPTLLHNLSLKWPHRKYIYFFNSISIIYFILKPKPYCPMKRKRKQIQCVISNRDLISSESAHSPSTARRYAKGIVLSQQIGFNEGSYASLKDLKNFYRKLNDDKHLAIALLLDEHLIYWVIRFPHTEPIKDILSIAF